MYEWLSDALSNSGTVVTANRRLARVLGEKYAAEQLGAGKKAWRSPAILSRQDWLAELASTAVGQVDLPTRINAQQSQLLWERCLRKDLRDSEVSIPNLTRLSRDTWQRLADWQVGIGDVARSAQNEDQRLFAIVAGRYLGVLEHENWVDDAGLGSLALKLIKDRRVVFSGRHTFVGFDRERPIIEAIQEAMADVGTEVNNVPDTEPGTQASLQAFENTSAELRSAGAWARQQVEHNPEARIAIIANGLEKGSDVIARHVREGATPGWQHGHKSLFDAVNVSYGRQLSDYPAISIAMILLRWLVDDLSSADVSMLLRSPLLGTTSVAGRSRLELRLRQLPDRHWSPSMITAELRGRDDGKNVSDWLARLAAFSKRRRELPKQATPAEWAVLFDEVLRAFGWPGQSALDSTEFQLINRWRELLNEFARLGLVSSNMAPNLAASRIELMANDTVFQPESSSAVVQLMGPLEASGAAFDALWLSGVTTTNWPPAGTPSSLVSRRLQEKTGMPDCTPANTLHYAVEMLKRLMGSGKTIVCSYALSDDDAEQTASGLLQLFPSTVEVSSNDPGWYAARFPKETDLRLADDSVPPVTAEERIAGGAGTIQRQLNDPISAFVQGRMAARVIYPQAVGIPAMMRGDLIHDALYNLYIDLPSSETIRGWQGRDLTERIDASVDFAFARHERNVDAVLQQLLLLERRRISDLLRQFVVVDGARQDFQVAGVEGKFEFVAGHIRLPLRFDRIDSVGENGIAILDYKTGAKKRLLNRKKEVQEIQLFVYACATEAPVSALALVNVDSREIAFDGAGLGYTDADEWPDLLQQIKVQISAACDEISGGDVRINIEQGIKSARPLNLLSRYTELRRDN